MQTVYIGGEKIKLLTVQETADLLGVSERTARQYLKDGLIPSCKVRRRLYVYERHLSAFFKGAKSTRRKKPVKAPQYETNDFPPDAWESP